MTTPVVRIHVRDIIAKLSYNNLVQDRVIPDVKALIPAAALTTNRYPPFVYAAKDFSFFGMYMDFVVRAGLRINLQQPVDLGVEPAEHPSTTLYQTTRNMNDVASTSLQLVSAMYGKEVYTKAQVYTYVATTVNIMKELVAQWQYYQYYLQGTIRYNTEFNHINVMGHPDIVTDNCVLDIKNTMSFGKMSAEACLQVLAYYALLKQAKLPVRYVGLILPMQRVIVVCDLGHWDHSSFLQLLSTTADSILAQAYQLVFTLPLTVIQPVAYVDTDQVTVANNQPSYLQQCRVGAHISKGNHIAKTLEQYAVSNPGTPCQIFLRNPRTGACAAKTVQQVPAAKLVIDKYQLQCFIHAPYVINLCSNECDNGDYWQQRYLNEDLQYAVLMGCRGVVVHTGAKKQLSEEQALNIMEYMVRNALQYATESCPLLLETPCGEGTEVCTTIEELGNFLFRFTDTELLKLGLCVDTCHIFAKKYKQLLAYLKHWKHYGPVPIYLVHLNDSKDDCCSCVDHHAFPGTGYIGEKQMKEVAQWCHVEGIPMVLE